MTPETEPWSMEEALSPEGAAKVNEVLVGSSARSDLVTRLQAFVKAESKDWYNLGTGQFEFTEITTAGKLVQEALAYLINEPQETPKIVWRIEHDGFEGVQIGSYVTLEGKRGAVLQQIGTRVVHVYGEKWLTSQLPCPQHSTGEAP